MKFKRILSIALSAFMLASTAGCGQGNQLPSGNSSSMSSISLVAQPQSESVNLIYYTIGNADEDLSKVNEELNQLLKKKINVTVQYNKIAWGGYGTKISALVNSGADFDIAFASGPDQGDYAGNAKKGAWLDMTDYLQKDGKAMYSMIDPLYWAGVKINGKIYGVPTNKEIAVPEWWMYPKELVSKYHIDISKYNTLESLEPLLALIKKDEPNWQPIELDKNSNNFFSLDGYEYVISKEVPLMVRSDDPGLKVVNIFNTETAKKTLDTLRKYYKSGYINEDAAMKESQSLERGKKSFWKAAGGGPYSEVSWSADRGYGVVAKQASKALVTTESTRGGLMVVNSRTKHPQACIQFLNLLNTDPEIRNLINYGLEGTHYKLNADNQVEKISESYSGVQYTQGNWFILNTVVGDPPDKWDKFREFNKTAVKSEMLGFTADTSKLTSKIAGVTQVWSKYYPALMTGSVDPEQQLPKFLSELKAAGIDEIQTALQKQLTGWKASTKK
jgi:putative aldouronate transport system substrate-binding protein